MQRPHMRSPYPTTAPDEYVNDVTVSIMSASPDVSEMEDEDERSLDGSLLDEVHVAVGQ